MARDYYSDSRALGADLWESGHEAWADRIDAVIEGGSTGTEILMGLRWTLVELLTQETSLDEGLRMRAESLRADISGALS